MVRQYNEAMSGKASQSVRFARVLQSGLTRPRFLRKRELEGQWVETLPDLGSLPEPFPIFGADENSVVAWGYPIHNSEGMRRIQAQLDRQIRREIDFRKLDHPDVDDRRKVVAGRDRIVASLQKAFVNAILNDYGRSLVDVFVLVISAEIQSLLASLPGFLARNGEGKIHVEATVRQLASMFGGLITRAATGAGDSIRKLSGQRTRTRLSPLFDLLCRDPLLLVERGLPSTDERLASLLSTGAGADAGTLIRHSRELGFRFGNLLEQRPEWRGLIRHVCGSEFNPSGPEAALEPAFIDLITEIGFDRDLGLDARTASGLRELGLRLKSLELVAALRQGLVSVDRQPDGGWAMVVGNRRTIIAPSTRPFDFAAQGVVDSAVFRFGLIYDLTDFTTVLEEVRKAGKNAEEKALQFMYVFQSRTEEIRVSRRLTFEKFMGDGAFFSARRAARVLAAACEIQAAYDRLRREGFPFDKGMRIAVNASEYRLLPMRSTEGNRPNYEFFGHGIVELARLTTGKSTREVAQVAELLIHAGYAPERVDDFLRPLIEARAGETVPTSRTYSVTLDRHGELVNEGIVLTVPFVEALESELGSPAVYDGELDDLRWLVLDVDPSSGKNLLVGLRLLGVARLKGLAPVELVEAVTWPADAPDLRPLRSAGGLTETLRRVGRSIGLEEEDGADAQARPSVPEQLVVVSFFDAGGTRHWIFGELREADDVLVQAISVPMVVPRSDDPLEMWLFRSRFDLARMYEALKRETSGVSRPMSRLRERPGFQAWFLAAPHRAP